MRRIRPELPDLAFLGFFACYVAAAVLWLALGLVLVPVQTGSLFEVSVQYLFSSLNLILGVLLIRLRPLDWTARLLALGMVGAGALFNLQPHLALGARVMPAPFEFFHEVFHYASGAAYLYGLLLFPDGKLPRWSVWPGLQWVAWAVYLSLLIVVGRIFLFQLEHKDAVKFAVFFVAFFGIVIPAGGIVSQTLRYRHAGGVAERQQSRLLIWALALTFIPGVVALLVLRLSSNIVRTEGILNQEQLAQLVFLVFSPLSAMIPVTLFVVLLRYRLWDIDRVINRALVYGVLSGTLALVGLATYVMGSLLLGESAFEIARPAVGEEWAGLIIVAATLVVAAMFRPARERIQQFIDRRFYRQKYHAARTLAELAETLRDEVDLDRLIGDVLAVVGVTLTPARATIWMRPTSRDETATQIWQTYARNADPNPRASQSPGVNESGDVRASVMQINHDDALIRFLEGTHGATDLRKVDLESDSLRALWAEDIREVVPLVSQGELVGVLNLGRRLGGQDYSVDDRDLLNALAAQAAPALRVAQLVRDQQAELRERERTEQELRTARGIQVSLLPKEKPSLDGWRVETYYRPAMAVGGDFYDFVQLSDGRLGILIGDVTGKGVPAALWMCITRTVLRGAVQRLVSPGPVLAQANDMLCPDMTANTFVTCLYALLDPTDGTLRYANAGHEIPYLRQASGVRELRATGMPLGLMPGMRYDELETTIGHGDRVLFYTDGLVEAHNSAREMFDLPRLRTILAANTASDGRGLIDGLLAELDRFVPSGWEQEDDITLLTLQRSGPSMAN